MHDQMGVMGGQSFSLFTGFIGHHRRTQHQVGGDDRFMGVIKGQYIGGVVFFTVVTVQNLAFLTVYDAHRDFAIAGQCVAYPARNGVARQGGAVHSSIRQCAELQG